MKKNFTLLSGSVLFLTGMLVPISPLRAAFSYTSSGRPCTIVGTSRNDTLNGTSGDDVICGLGGNDTVGFVPGRNAVDMTALNDRSTDWAGVVDGGPGNDTILGSTGRDRLDGGFGSDTVYGFGGDDRRRVGDDG